MQKLIIKGGSVVLLDETIEADLLIQDGKISQIEPNIVDNDAMTIDAKGKHILAGFVDIHTHLREPGFTNKEDIESGTAAAVKGGITAVACMPNTKPVLDNKVAIEYVVNRAKLVASNKVYPIASVTKGQEGKELADYAILKQCGACAISDDGRPMANLRILKNALEYSKECGIILISHAEDVDLTDGGDVHESYYSTLTGLKGIPRASEDCAVAREIALAEALDARIHFAHISTQGAVKLIKEAKARGAKVSAETCPHYFSLDNKCILDYNTATKVNPPIREEQDVVAIIKGLADGTIDIIATDHAPHHFDDKNCEYSLAANGISGFETSFALAYTYLVKPKHLSINQLSKKMTYNPSNLLNIGTKELAVGADADIVIVDLNKKWTVKSREFVSKGKNTPFDGMQLYGQVVTTIVDGKIKYSI